MYKWADWRTVVPLLGGGAAGGFCRVRGVVSFLGSFVHSMVVYCWFVAALGPFLPGRLAGEAPAVSLVAFAA